MFSEWNVLIFQLAPSDILRILEQAFLQKMIEKVSGELLTEVKRVVNRKSSYRRQGAETREKLKILNGEKWDQVKLIVNVEWE